jgi:hypothetical protein
MSALDGLQREWLRRDNDKNNHKRPTQQQQFGRPKLAPMPLPAKKVKKIKKNRQMGNYYFELFNMAFCINILHVHINSFGI